MPKTWAIIVLLWLDFLSAKADVVREMIREAKDTGTTVEQVVASVVQKLDMAKALATSYVKNNWNKV